MAFTPFTVALALGALVFGSVNTLTNNWACNQSALGTDSPATIWGKLNQEIGTTHTFDHPFFTALFMFIGEFLCLFAHAINRKRQPSAQPGSIVQKGTFWFAIPGCCDLIGTGVMYCGLCLSSASIFQMLRGSVVVFTAILSRVWLKRKIYVFQWCAVVTVVIGISIVGSASLKNLPKGKDQTGVLVGDILIVLAQMVTAFQMCCEEKLITKFQPDPLKVVGLEGLFGGMALTVALVPMYFLKVDGAPIENVPDAIEQLKNNNGILLACSLNALSIAFFNTCGIGITKELSCSHRMVLDTMRTFIVWGASLMLGWEHFSWVQLIGFLLVTTGIAVYNEIITAKWLFTYPSAAGASKSFIGDADHGSFLGRLEEETAATLPLTEQDTQ